MTGTSRKALVIGATGGVGGAVARMLAARGWQVSGLNRDPARAALAHPSLPVAWVAGDAMRPADVARAAEGAAILFHGANPPGYRNWAGTVVPMLDSAIAAARAQKARILFPGTVYSYGPDAGACVAEDAPQNPLTRKGRLRAEMERRLEDSGVPVLIVRAGDFFGPGAANSWLAQGVVTPGRPLRSVTYPGDPDAGHAWAYLPDLAETFGRLLDRVDDLAPFARFHFGGHWLAPGIALAEAIRRVAGRDLPVKKLPWWAIRLIAPFHETMREMLEMRYLWQRPLRLDNARLVALLGAEPHTPLDEALRVTLCALGCLKQPSAAARKAAFA
ncbi:MAG: NAD(P)H-binding protein [Alphaproteobacteria bacterium]|nr:NAD(P)H-binding protein [Alphaproteobacteria bacterium]